MPTFVTIRGSLTPSVVLKRDEFKTVQLTDRVQRLIDRGFVEVTERHEVADADEGTDDNTPDPDGQFTEDGEPKPGATKKVWVEFAGKLDPPLAIPDGATRDQIAAAYVEYKQQRAGGS